MHVWLLNNRLEGAYDSCDDGSFDVVTDLHLQQQLHTLYNGHLEKTPAKSL